MVADQVEDLVTKPIESALIGATDVAKVHAESVQGLSIITVRFAAGANPLVARQAVSERLSAIAGALPAGVAPPHVAPLTSRGADVFKIGFTSAKLDPMALRDLVQWTVRPRLLGVAGVARVAVYGGETRRIEVRARPGDLSDSDLGFLDILNAVKRATSVVGAGFIDTDTQRVLIEPRGQTLTADDVGAGQIQTAGSAPVRINDVADVVEAPAPAVGDALIDGRPGVLVDIAKQYGANTLQDDGQRRTRARRAEAGPCRSGRRRQDRPRSAGDLRRHGGARYNLGPRRRRGAHRHRAGALLSRSRRADADLPGQHPTPLLAALLALKALGWSLNAMTAWRAGAGDRGWSSTTR